MRDFRIVLEKYLEETKQRNTWQGSFENVTWHRNIACHDLRTTRGVVTITILTTLYRTPGRSGVDEHASVRRARALSTVFLSHQLAATCHFVSLQRPVSTSAALSPGNRRYAGLACAALTQVWKLPVFRKYVVSAFPVLCLD